jgi:hypothetical protein
MTGTDFTKVIHFYEVMLEGKVFSTVFTFGGHGAGCI